MIRFALLILAVSAGLKGYWGTQTQSLCRCRPGEVCWPTASDWEHLNHSIDGNLQTLKPAGHVCSGDQYSKEACEEYVKNFHNGTWRVLNPASLQVINWENWRAAEESCHVDGITNATCQQGRVPVYAASVKTVEQVRGVVCFAADHNLRLSVRNTGHDLAGRSTSPESLMVHTAGLKEIRFTTSFRTTSPLGYESEDYGPAVTVGAGVMTEDLYASAAEHGYSVAGGSCGTVGIAGGWMASGGYGILTPSKGLGVDNVLEVGMVTAAGAYVIANAYQNQDLFQAVRGGGGGTFGIITSVTFRVFPDVPLEVARLTAVAEAGPGDAFWSGVQEIMGTIPQLGDQGIAVQSYAFPFAESGSLISAEIFSINQTETSNMSPVDRLFESWKNAGLQVQRSHEHFAQISSYHASRSTEGMAGVGVMVGSRLVSGSSLNAPERLSRALSQLKYHPGDMISLDGMAPGLSVERKSHVPHSLHPAWDSAAMILTLGRGLPLDPNWEAYEQAEEELKHTQLPAIDSLESATIAGYLGVPFPHEADHAGVFWGEKYDVLLATKRRWDPNDLFITRLGVGSEGWDDEAMCRKQTSTAWEKDLRRLWTRYSELVALL
ncbi:FAD-binding domain-containing protein [Aspergillus brunneoviolaceus CBS 621.78]|uniref:FAD-binding domain-containing protein n=1 Tax=Aspergillus brunneoviolaceus CBS 621.78 TaxID=1450534 RepID=A0ACD1GPE8_9EURO|nr:FAD-binding domain-containing protein [Aspergillus brunneoviolaceus CBS 621.78]RAH51239.1 FAD-binding domain-containing protein [Aspergillus brunneoviolaceus CBS 621.78]